MITNTSKVALLASSCLIPSLTMAALDSLETIAKVELSNPSDFARTDEPVYFDTYDLGLRETDARANQLVARHDGIILPSQTVDDDGDGFADRFLTLVNFEPTEERTIEIVVDPTAVHASFGPKRTQAEISHKVGGHWEGREYIDGTFTNVQSLTPPAQHTDHSYFIRYEGPGIESDKVGYRIYLDWRNGFDIFSKKKHELALHQVGLDGFDSYHEPADWGMDTLKVGDSLGCGGFGFWDGESVVRVSEVDGWDALVKENGNIRSSMEIKYKGWEVNDQKTDVTATVSMVAGSHLVNVHLAYDEHIPNTALGIVDHGVDLIEGDRDISNFGAWTYIATWGKQSLNDDNLGMAVFFRKGDLDKVTKDDHSHVAVIDTGANQFDYYFCSVWESEPNGISSKEAFIDYLDKETERLTIATRREVETAVDKINKGQPITAQAALDYSVRMSESERKRLGMGLALGYFDPDRGARAKWTYTTGLLMQAIEDAAIAADRADLQTYADKVMDSFIEDDGTITGYEAEKYNIDMINSGKYILTLWERTGDERYKKAADHLRAQLVDHPRTSEGAFWHKQIYPGQLWLDGVYMGMPFLAHYSQLFEDGKSYKEAVHEFEIARDRLRDPETGLYYHGWDEHLEQDWADKKTGLSQEFWGRGYGWYSMAIVDVLDHLPESETKLRKTMINLVQEVADSLLGVQDPDTGVWYQVMDKPDTPGNYLESSASSMFVYLLAKGINEGYLSDDYKQATLKGYEGLINEFIGMHANGSISLKDVCKVAGLGFGRDGSFRYYMTEEIVDNGPHGVGPFIMAGVEVHKLLSDD